MADERIEAVRGLLGEAESAHGSYEATELGGVYDQDWPRWYAVYAVEHGLSSVLGRDLTAGEVEEFLSRSNRDYDASDVKKRESWAAYTARRIAAEL